MKKINRTPGYILFILILAFSMLLPVSADDPASDVKIVIAPTRTNYVNVISSFNINSSGYATARAAYYGTEGITLCAITRIKIQKKVLLWWSTVDNGQPDNTWADALNGHRNSATHSLQLTDEGEYRAVIEYTIYSINGISDSPDEITENVIDEY